jgi:uncharacterized iron-regulated protein
MLGALMLVLLQAQPVPAPMPALPPNHPPLPSQAVVLVSYVPERVFDSKKKKFTDFEAMLADLSRADVILVGEQHDDRNTHRLEVAILEGLMRRRGQLTVSLEMFERDAQQALSAYVAGELGEEEFLKQSRPWPRYSTDYRPIVELARGHGWAVIASNVPRRLASQVAKGGIAALDQLSPEERAWAARSIECPDDDYRERFVATMNEHPIPGSEKLSREERKALDDRYYFSQCVKDETMAEAIAAAHGPGHPLIVHFTGAFHADFGHGTAQRVERRLKNARVAVVSLLPVDNLDTLKPGKDERKRADYLVYTLKPQPSPHTR